MMVELSVRGLCRLGPIAFLGGFESGCKREARGTFFRPGDRFNGSSETCSGKRTAVNAKPGEIVENARSDRSSGVRRLKGKPRRERLLRPCFPFKVFITAQRWEPLKTIGRPIESDPNVSRRGSRNGKHHRRHSQFLANPYIDIDRAKVRLGRDLLLRPRPSQPELHWKQGRGINGATGKSRSRPNQRRSGARIARAQAFPPVELSAEPRSGASR